MKKHIFLGLFIIAGLFQARAQEKYIGLSQPELIALVDFAKTLDNEQELAKLNSYIGFIKDLDTLYEVFSANLKQANTSASLKAELRSRIKTLDELSYFGRKYREYRLDGNEEEAALSLEQYYISLEKLELKEYFLGLGGEQIQNEANSSSSESFASPAYDNSKWAFYLGLGLNYSLPSHQVIALDPSLIGMGITIDDNSIGGLSRDFYLGTSYQINQDVSGFLELGFSGQNLSHETITTLSDPNFPEGDNTFTRSRDLQHRYTDLKFGAAYRLDKLNLKLGLQMSFLNSFELTVEQKSEREGDLWTQEYDPDLEYGFNATRSFLILGADYPIYSFYMGNKNFFLDAYFQASIGLSSVIDEEAEDVMFNLFGDTESFNNNLLHLGIRLRL